MEASRFKTHLEPHQNRCATLLSIGPTSQTMVIKSESSGTSLLAILAEGLPLLSFSFLRFIQASWPGAWWNIQRLHLEHHINFCFPNHFVAESGLSDGGLVKSDFSILLLLPPLPRHLCLLSRTVLAHMANLTTAVAVPRKGDCPLSVTRGAQNA